MSLYDDNPLLLARPRSFWEEEEEPAIVQPPVAPPAAPPPEVEGPGYASLEDIPEEAPPPEVVGPGYASLEEIPEEQPPPEVEGPGYASLDEIPGVEEPSVLGKIARAGYRTAIAPFTEPIKTAREGLSLAKLWEPEEGSRRAEFGARIKRNFATNLEETKAALREMPAGLLSAEQNPYVNKSVEQAKADVPLLEKQIAEEEKSFRAAGGDPELVGQEWSIEPLPELMGQSQRISDLRRQLMYAKEGVTGKTTESFAGALSRSAQDIAEENRARKEEIVKEYAPLIGESRNKEFWMQVAGSIGSSGPSMLGSIANPLFGLGLMYASTFESSRAEFLKKGGDPAKANEYAHAQAALQTPLEILGELPVAGIARGVLKRLAEGADVASWVNWVQRSAIDLGKSFAGEVGVTTPGQTIIEQKLGEEYGVKPPMTWEELQKNIWEQQKVAGAQVLLTGGGPLAAEAATMAAGRVLAPGAPVVTPEGTVAPPPIPPTPDEAFAPPGVTITPAPGEVPTPADLAGVPPPVAPPITPPGVEPTGDERFAPPVMSTPVEPGQPPTPEGVAVTQEVGAENLVVKGVADSQAAKLQSANAPKTADAIKQVAARSNAGATVSAAEFLQQARAQAAEAQAEAAEEAAVEAEKAAKEAPAAAPGAVKPGEFAQPGYTAAVPAPAQAAPVAIPPNEDEALVAAEQRANTGDVMGARNALNRVGFFNEDIKPPDNWDGTTTEWEEQRARNAAINKEIARRRKNVEMQLPPTEEAAAPAQAAPAAAPTTEYPAAVVVGGQVFTGATHEDATRAAHAAVGPDAMVSSEGGWVDPETGKFVSHEIFEAHRDYNTAVDEAGGNMEAPAVQEAQAQLAEAVARDDELNNQITYPGGEQVIKPGIKGQEALISVRPSQELAAPLAGVNVTVAGVTPDGRKTTAQRPAAQALNDARNDKTAFQILLNCLT